MTSVAKRKPKPSQPAKTRRSAATLDGAYWFGREEDGATWRLLARGRCIEQSGGRASIVIAKGLSDVEASRLQRALEDVRISELELIAAQRRKDEQAGAPLAEQFAGETKQGDASNAVSQRK